MFATACSYVLLPFSTKYTSLPCFDPNTLKPSLSLAVLPKTSFHTLCQTLSLLCLFDKPQSLTSLQMPSRPPDLSYSSCRFLSHGPLTSSPNAVSTNSSRCTTKSRILAKATTATSLMSENRAFNSRKLLLPRTPAPIKPLVFGLLGRRNGSHCMPINHPPLFGTQSDIQQGLRTYPVGVWHLSRLRHQPWPVLR